MTLDILHFIDNKGGNAEEIRESQRKRGHPVEIVDEIIQMYADWVKSSVCFGRMCSTADGAMQWTTMAICFAKR